MTLTARPVPVGPPCLPSSPSAPDMPLVHVGPDVSLEIPRGGGGVVPIASVSSLAGDGFRWRTSIEGDTSIFSAPAEYVATCPAGGVTVVNVTVDLPLSALPGDAFEAKVTVSAEAGAFPTRSATVRVKVGAPTFSVDPQLVDFGDVPYGESRALPVRFINGSTDILYAETQQQEVSPFYFGSAFLPLKPGSVAGLTNMVGLLTADVGEHTAEITWRAGTRQVDLPDACYTRRTVKLHARIVPPDGGGP